MVQHTHDLHQLVVLAGLVIEICGAFVLAAEAIGLTKITRWGGFFGTTRLWLTDGVVFSSHRRAEMFLMIFLVLSGWTIGTVVYIRLLWHTAYWAAGLLLIPAIGALASSVALTMVSWLLALAAASGERLLIRTIVATERKTAGAFGFALLLIGFSFQFVGTLGAFLNAR